jgi:hypothetical protein
MKKQIIAVALAACTFTAAKAQDYKPVLQNTFIAFDTTRNNEQARMEQANKLVLIAKKWPAEWATNYYAAYSKVQLSYMEKDAAKKDAYLDDADMYLKEAVRLMGKDNDETYVLAAMIANARISVNGQARWQKYGKVFDENLEKAKAINPDNPRIYLVRGISKFYTPKMFGGGKKAAMPYFEKADGLFAKETGTDILRPTWGRQTNEYFKAQAKGEDKD